MIRQFEHTYLLTRAHAKGGRTARSRPEATAPTQQTHSAQAGGPTTARERTRTRTESAQVGRTWRRAEGGEGWGQTGTSELTSASLRLANVDSPSIRPRRRSLTSPLDLFSSANSGRVDSHIVHGPGC